MNNRDVYFPAIEKEINNMLPAEKGPELWRLFKTGDLPSFQTIYRTYFDGLYQYGLRITADKEVVKDAIQDLFVKLWSNKSNLGDVQLIKSYLFVALRQGMMNSLQRNRKIQLTAIDVDTSFEILFSMEPAYEDKETHATQSRELINALNQLSPRQKEVIYLRYFEEIDYEQIAEVMNISIKAVYKLRGRGIATLQDVLQTSHFIIISSFLSLEKIIM